MDEETQRGHGWKILFHRVHADELELFREYIGIVDDALERLQTSHAAAVARELSREPDEEKKGYIEMYHSEEGSKLGIALPAMSNAQTFISLLSYLENEMFVLCERLQKNKKRSLGVKDLAGRGIEQAANYLEKICEVREFRKTPVWNEINMLQKIRNILVHNRGVVREIVGKNDADKELRRYAFEKSLLADASASELLLTKEFCFEAIEKVKSMLWMVIDRVPIRDIAGEKPS